MMHHEFKTLQSEFNLFRYSQKSFIIRKNNNLVQRGDLIFLKEYIDSPVEPENGYTGRYLRYIVSGVTQSGNDNAEGLNQGYCVLSIQRL